MTIGTTTSASDRQPETGSLSGPRGIRAEEALEDPLLAALGQSWPGVADLEVDLSVPLGDRDAHRRPAVPERVVDEDANGPAECFGIAGHER